MSKYDECDQEGVYSELQVMRSAAGYYVGTDYSEFATGRTCPGSRDSEYFKTREEAQEVLERMSVEPCSYVEVEQDVKIMLARSDVEYKEWHEAEKARRNLPDIRMISFSVLPGETIREAIDRVRSSR